MKLVFLGTGGSYPSPKRNVPSIAIKFKGEVILFDCGEGTQRQFMRSSLSFMETKRIFVTHFHGDHILGLPGLIQSMNLNDRDEELEIYGPRGNQEMCRRLINLGYFRPNFPVKVVEIEPGAVLRFDDYSVEAVSSDHNVPSLAYIFKENDKKGRFDREKALELGVPEGPLFSRLHKGQEVEVDGKKIHPDQIVGAPRRGKKIVYTGDTRPSVEICDAARDSNILIHDATLESEMSDMALERGHSSVRHAAEAAKKAGVDRLFLFHMSPRYESTKGLLDEAREIFKETTIPSDLSEYEL
ncbi:MAG: ribonuclease Z [Candidatus Saliniplasma sp.]